MEDRKVPARAREAIGVLAMGRPGWLVRVLENGRLDDVLADHKEYGARMAGGLAERLVWAKDLATRDDIRELIVQWLAVERAGIHDEAATPERVHQLIELHETLGNVSLRERIALEHFLLST